MVSDNKEMLLIANLTHQAINPLNGVIGTLDNVIKGVVPEEKKSSELIVRDPSWNIQCLC